MTALGLLVGIGNAVGTALFVGMLVLGILSLVSLFTRRRLRWAWFYCWRVWAAFAAANLVTWFPGRTWADGESYAVAVIAAPWVVFYWLFWSKDRPPTNDTEPEPVDPASSDPVPSVRFELTKRANEGYKDSRSLTNWIRGFLCAWIAVSVVALVSNALEYQLLVGAKDGFYPGDAAFEASDTRQGWIELLQMAVYPPTMVLILIWIRRANYNVCQLGARGLRFSPVGSIGWYFVPIVHLWRPYQAMKEIWQASSDPENWPNRPVPVLLPVWWAFWLVSIALANVDFRLWWSLDENSSVNDFIAANIAAQVAGVWSIPLALLLVAIVNSCYRMQAEHRRPPLARNSTSGAQAGRVQGDKGSVGAKRKAIIRGLNRIDRHGYYLPTSESEPSGSLGEELRKKPQWRS